MTSLKPKRLIGVGIIFSLLFANLIVLSTPTAYAAPNYQINYQGKLTDSTGTAVSDGSYAVTFSLYTASTGGSALWTEAHTAANKVTVTNGLFSTMLGSLTSLSTVDFNQTLYLGVTVESDSEMTPRKILGAVPAAFQADKLDGLDAADFISTSTATLTKVWSSTGLGQIGSSTATTTFLGNLAAVGTTVLNGILSVYQNVTAPYFTATSTSVASVFPYASTTAITATTASTTNLIISGLGSGLTKVTNGVVSLATAGTDYLTSTFKDWQISGGYLTPTTTQVVKLNNGFVSTASSTVSGLLTADSASTTALTVTGIASTTNLVVSSNIGISTSTPTSLLSIYNGAVYSRTKGLHISDGTRNGYFYQFSSAGTFALQSSGDLLFEANGGSEIMRLIGSTKFVGIGTSTPGEKLSVDGNGLFNGKITGQYFTATSTSVASVFPYASTTAITATTASTTNLIISGLGSGLTKVTNGVLSLATAGTDYLTSTFKDWQISGGYLTPTTTQTVKLNNGFVSTASSTVSGLLTLGSASSTALTVSGYLNTPSIVSDSDITVSPTASFTVDNSTYVSLGTASGGSFLLSGGSTSLTSSSGGIGLYPNSGVIDLHNSQGGATDGAKLAFWDSGSAVSRIYLDSSQDGVSYFNAGNVGVGTDTPYAKLSVVGQTVSLYFTATSTSRASTFPYASTTVLSASTLCLTGDLPCRTTWPTGSGSSFGQAWEIVSGYLTPTTTKTVLLNNGFVSAASSTVSGQLAVSGSLGVGTSTPAGGVVIANSTSAFGINPNSAGSSIPGNSSLGVVQLQLGRITNGPYLQTFQSLPLLINAGGNKVAIGTSTPYADLTLWGSNSSALTKGFEIANSASTSLLTVLNSGNLGVGTSSPYARLSVVGQTVSEYFTATSTTQASTFPYASTTALTITGSLLDMTGAGSFIRLPNEAATKIQFMGSSNGDAYSIAGAANALNLKAPTAFNIGTSAAVSQASFNTINGSLTLAGVLTVSSTTAASTLPYASTTALTVSGTAGLNLLPLSGSGEALVVVTGYSGTGYKNNIYSSVNTGTSASNYLRFDISNSAGTSNEVMRINGAGNVGIGNTTPTSTLDVIGTPTIIGRFGKSNVDSATAPTTVLGANYLQIGGQEYNAANSSPSLRLIGFGYNHSKTTEYSPAYIGYKETDNSASTLGNLVFYTRAVGTGTTQPSERLTIQSDGDVGISSTTPAYLFAIGTGSSAFSVSSTGVATSTVFNAVSTSVPSIFPLASTTALTISGSGKSFNITNSNATSTILGDVNIAGSTGVTIWTNEGNSAVAQGSLNIGSATPGNGLRVTRVGGTDTTFARFVEAGGAFASFIDGTGIQLDLRDTGGSQRILFDTNGNNFISPASGNVYFNPAAGAVAVGTSTSPSTWAFQVASNKLPFVLSDTSAGTNLKHWAFASQGGNLYIATSTDAYATSTISALTVNVNGFLGLGTTTPGTLLSLGNTGNNTINLSTSATSTFGTGINIRGGCYAINGTCLSSSGGGSGTVNSSSDRWIPYYAGNGTTLSGTSTIRLSNFRSHTSVILGDESGSLPSLGALQIYGSKAESSALTYTNASGNEGLVINSYYNSGSDSLSSGNTVGYADFVAQRFSQTGVSGGSFFRFLTQPFSSSDPGVAFLIDEQKNAAIYGGVLNGGKLNSSSVGNGMDLAISGGSTASSSSGTVKIAVGYLYGGSGTEVEGGHGGNVIIAAGGNSDNSNSAGFPAAGNAGNVYLAMGGDGTNGAADGNDGTVQIGGGYKNNAVLSVYGDVKVRLSPTGGAVSTFGVCHDGTDINATGNTSLRKLVACSAAPSDVAEMYPTKSEVEPGDIVAASSDELEYMAEGGDPYNGTVADLGTTTISILKRANKGESGVLGVISTGPFQTFGRDIQKVEGANAKPVALVGRVPVKVTLEGGDIRPGDRITLSSVPGVGMKASTSGMTIGVAISSFNASSPKDASGVGKVNVFVNLSYAKLDSAISGGNLADGLWTLDDTTGRLKAFSSLDLNNMDINNVRSIQSGSGDWSISADGILVVKEVRTQKLCLGQICITETDLRSLLDHAGLGAVGSAPSGDTSTTTPTGGTGAGSDTTTPPADPPSSEPPPADTPPTDSSASDTPPTGDALPSDGDTEAPTPDPTPTPEPAPAPAPVADPAPATL